MSCVGETAMYFLVRSLECDSNRRRQEKKMSGPEIVEDPTYHDLVTHAESS